MDIGEPAPPGTPVGQTCWLPFEQIKHLLPNVPLARPGDPSPRTRSAPPEAACLAEAGVVLSRAPPPQASRRPDRDGDRRDVLAALRADQAPAPADFRLARPGDPWPPREEGRRPKRRMPRERPAGGRAKAPGESGRLAAEAHRAPAPPGPRPLEPAICRVKFDPALPPARHPTPFAIGGRLAPPAQGNRRAVDGLSACSGTTGRRSTLWQGRRSWQLGSRGIIFVPFIPLLTAGVARRASPSPPESPWRRRPWGPCSPRPRGRAGASDHRLDVGGHALFGPAPAPSEGSRITRIGIGKALGQSAADFESS
jgi:hypothetical protein